MEKTVEDLSVEIQKLAKESAKQDTVIQSRQANFSGAIDLSRYLLSTAVTVVAVVVTWVGSRATDPLRTEPRQRVVPRPTVPHHSEPVPKATAPGDQLL